jgi:hypothetical protein
VRRVASLCIRPAAAADHPAIRRVIASAYQQYAATLSPAVFRAYLTDLTDLDARADADLLVGITGETVIALAYKRSLEPA